MCCQHLQVDGIKSDPITLGMAQGQNSRAESSSVVCSTMYLACMDIKTAFDESRPRHVAKIMENHETHGCLIVAFLREMSGLEGKSIV